VFGWGAVGQRRSKSTSRGAVRRTRVSSFATFRRLFAVVTYGDSGGWFFEAAFSVCGKLLNVLGSKKGAGKSKKATITKRGGEGVNCAKSVEGNVRKAHYMVPEKQGPFFRDTDRSTLEAACKTDAVRSLVFEMHLGSTLGKAGLNEKTAPSFGVRFRMTPHGNAGGGWTPPYME